MSRFLLDTAFKLHRRRTLLTLSEASNLLHEFHHEIFMSDLRGEDAEPVTGTFPVTLQTYNRLISIAAGNPMADQRRELGWSVRCIRDGQMTGELAAISCRFPIPHHKTDQYELRFTVPDREAITTKSKSPNVATLRAF